MIIRAPADHIFSMQKIPELEIQIIHESEEVDRANPYNFVLVSKLYMVSKFSSKIETNLGEYLNPVVRGGGVLKTEKLVRLIDGFPVNLGIARCSCTKEQLKLFHAGWTCSASWRENISSYSKEICNNSNSSWALERRRPTTRRFCVVEIFIRSVK